jgi:hypothetical protein
MLITKFNKLIRNKLVWGFFAIIVCLSFVGVSFLSNSGKEQRTNNVGTINGEEVAYKEFNKTRVFEQGFRSTSQLSDSEIDELDKATWKRLATLRYAATLGIICTSDEIDSVVLSDPRFQINGAFDQATYESSVQQELGIPTQMLEEYMSQEIILNRMRVLAGTMVLTPVSELQQKLQRLTDIVEADYAFIANEIKLKNIKLTEEEALEYFTKNIDLFKVPEKMNVNYVQFPIADFTSQVSVTEQDAREYYEDNISDYSSRNTNDDLVTIEFTDVADEITTTLLWEEASYQARDTATTFVMDLMPDRDGVATPLEDALKENQLNITTSKFFSLLENVKGVDAGYDFNRAAFDLVPADPERRISDAIVGSSNVYVLIANEKIASRLPSFEEVEKEVKPYAKSQKASLAFDRQTTELRETVIKSIEDGKGFKEALKSKKIKVFSSEPFSVYSDMTNEVEYSEVIVPAVMSLDKGDVSDLIPTEDGYLLIHLTGREAGDLLSTELLRPQLVSAISRYRSSVLFYEMQDQLLARTVIIPDSADEDEEEIEEE